MPPPSTPGFTTIPGCRALVTGSSGLVGGRLVEMLLERGAHTVVCFDLRPPTKPFQHRCLTAIKTGKRNGTVEFIEGDLTDAAGVHAACVDVDVVYHIAALVGPFFKRPLYFKVNVDGTANILAGCKANGVKKIVMSSSPSTRFTGADIEGLREDELPIPSTFLETYAETKAIAEVMIEEANGKDGMLTIAVAPHQVYGPHDELFVPNLLAAAGNGSLRVFGNGDNLCSFCYVDNYAHGLMCGADALYEGSPALGKFYIVTDEEPQKFWRVINRMGVEMGFADMFQKIKLPVMFMMFLGYVCEVLGYLLGRRLKLNVFSVKMMVIHRYFSPTNSRRDLLYKPLVTFEEGWSRTIEWYKENWLGKWKEKNGKK